MADPDPSPLANTPRAEASPLDAAPSLDALSRAAGEQLIEQGVAALYTAGRARVRELAERFHPELQPAGYGILRHLMINEPLRAGDIVTGLGVDKSAVSRQVATLREMGLVDISPDPDDGRASLLVSTPRARDARDVFRAENAQRYSEIFADWSDADIAAFARLLTKFNDSIH